MKSLLALVAALLAQTSFAKEININKQTPNVIPAEQIFVFPELDWEKIEKLQDAGKESSESMVMLCDDSYFQKVEIKLALSYKAEENEKPLDGVTVSTDSCEFFGSSDTYNAVWLHFGLSKSGASCTVTIEKKREAGKTPLKMTFEIGDAC